MRCLGLSIHTSPIMQRVDKVFDDADDVFKEAMDGLLTFDCSLVPEDPET